MENLPTEQPNKEVEISFKQGIIPANFNDLTRFASLVLKSRLAPKSFDTLEKIAIGILTNMEMGRPIITGLQDLAIINGRCGIYGDATGAMILASGLMDVGYPIEEETGTPFTDDWTFTYKVKRKGGTERVGKWDWKDAKLAGFDKPKMRDGRADPFSPWTRFPRRMMQWKARNFVNRDTFGDVLKGLKTVEELHEIVDMIPSDNGKYEVEEGAEQRGDDISKALDEVPLAKETGAEEPKGAIVTKEKVTMVRDTQQEAGPKGQPTAGQTLQDNIQEIEKKEYLDDINPEIRKLYISKRKGKGKSGLSGVVMEHANQIPYWPKANFDELMAKWAMLYKGNPPFPKSIRWLGPGQRPEKELETAEDTQEETETDRVKDPDNQWREDPEEAGPDDIEPEPDENKTPELCNRCDKQGCGGALNQLYQNVDGALHCEVFAMDNNPETQEYIECAMYGQRKNIKICATCKKGTDGKCPEYNEYLESAAIQFGKGRAKE